jgi:hypothetical protein
MTDGPRIEVDLGAFKVEVEGAADETAADIKSVFEELVEREEQRWRRIDEDIEAANGPDHPHNL